MYGEDTSPLNQTLDIISVDANEIATGKVTVAQGEQYRILQISGSCTRESSSVYSLLQNNRSGINSPHLALHHQASDAGNGIARQIYFRPNSKVVDNECVGSLPRKTSEKLRGDQLKGRHRKNKEHAFRNPNLKPSTASLFHRVVPNPRSVQRRGHSRLRLRASGGVSWQRILRD